MQLILGSDDWRLPPGFPGQRHCLCCGEPMELPCIRWVVEGGVQLWVHPACLAEAFNHLNQEIMRAAGALRPPSTPSRS